MTKKTILMALLALILVHCSKKKDKNELVLDLGQPGEIKLEGDLHAKEDVIVLDKNEKIDFLTEDGQAIIEHKKSITLKPGDIIVANEEQRYLLKVKEVREVVDRGTHVVVRQSNMEDLLNDETSSIKLEATPKYDLPEVEKYVKKAADKKQLETIQPSVDENGRIVVRNLELFSFHVNDNGRIQKDQSRFFGKEISVRNKPVNFSFTASGLYEAKLNEMVIDIIPTVRNEMEWKGRRINKMECRFDTRVKYRVDITYKIAGMGKMEAMIDLLPVKKIPLRVPGTPPVWLDIELSVPVGVSVEGTAKGETRVIYEAEYDFYALTSYDKKTGMRTDSKQKTKVNDKSIVTTTRDFDLKAELFLKPNIMVRAYRLAGPYVYLQPYVRGDMEIPQRTKKDDLYVGVKGGVGIEFSEPIFTTAILSYDSGEIFDFNTSFDLDGFAGAPRQSVGGAEKNDVTVDRIGNEGFVVINAKTISKDAFARFELLEGTKTGILVPAEDFYLSGALHYYPLPNSRQESFTIRITESDGNKLDIPIALGITDSVQQEVSKERFGLTTNSYRVATEGSGPFAGNVPHYSAGSVGIRASEDFIRQSSINEWVRSIVDPVFSMIPRDTYNECRFQSPLQLNNYEGDPDREMRSCLSENRADANMGNIFQISQKVREVVYSQKLEKTDFLVTLPLLAVLDAQAYVENSLRIVDLAISECLGEVVKFKIEKNKVLRQYDASGRCLHSLLELSDSRSREGIESILRQAPAVESLDVLYHYSGTKGYYGHMASFTVGQHTMSIGIRVKRKAGSVGDNSETSTESIPIDITSPQPYYKETKPSASKAREVQPLPENMEYFFESVERTIRNK
jgi:hypothetical protein